MKKVLKYILLFIVAVIAIVLIAGIFISRDFHFETSIVINAPKEKVWQNVGTLAGMDKWNPWNERDPNMQKSTTGQDGTVGAVMSWKGNKDVGSGSQTIKQIDAPNRIETDLHFIEPFDSRAVAYVNLTDEQGGTKVVWGFDSRFPYPFNVLSKFMNMKEGLGKDFNGGLIKLKKISEE